MMQRCLSFPPVLLLLQGVIDVCTSLGSERFARDMNKAASCRWVLLALPSDHTCSLILHPRAVHAAASDPSPRCMPRPLAAASGCCWRSRRAGSSALHWRRSRRSSRKASRLRRRQQRLAAAGVGARRAAKVARARARRLRLRHPRRRPPARAAGPRRHQGAQAARVGPAPAAAAAGDRAVPGWWRCVCCPSTCPRAARGSQRRQFT